MNNIIINYNIVCLALLNFNKMCNDQNLLISVETSINNHEYIGGKIELIWYSNRVTTNKNCKNYYRVPYYTGLLQIFHRNFPPWVF